MPRKKAEGRQRRGNRVVKGDKVRVIRGNFRDLEGTVLRVDRGASRVVVEGVNLRKRHQRPTQGNPDGGIISFEAPMALANVMLIDPTSGEPSRIRIHVDKDGTKERMAVKNGNPIPSPKA